MSKPTLYRNRLIPLESILLTNDEILYHDDKKIITFWKTLHPKSDLAYGYSCYFLDRGFKISRFYSVGRCDSQARRKHSRSGS